MPSFNSNTAHHNATTENALDRFQVLNLDDCWTDGQFRRLQSLQPFRLSVSSILGGLHISGGCLVEHKLQTGAILGNRPISFIMLP